MLISRPTAVATSAAVLLLGTLLGAAPSAMAAESAARLDTYSAPDGKHYFALSLAAESLAPPAAHDIVVLVDTSASQAGPYREKQLAALQSLLAKLSPQDRVALVAVDLHAIPLSEGFVAAGSAELQQALAKLQQRVPLGSTDMAQALRTAIEQFADAKQPRAAVYLGDGISSAQLLGSQQFEQLTRQLVEHRIPVSSYAVGPQTDARLLAALANQTGGNLAVAGALVLPDPQNNISFERAAEENRRAARAMGAQLAQSAQAAVLWPSQAKLPEGFAEVYPARLPPLRSDRDTVLIGVGPTSGEQSIEINAVSAEGQARTLNWKVTPREPNEDQAYLAQLVELARRDGGATLPTVGTVGLHETRRLLAAGVDNLTELAEQAAATGNVQNAEVLAREVLRRDPTNPIAQAVQRTVSEASPPAATPRAAVNELKMVNAQIEPPPDPAPVDVPGDESFIDRIEAQNQVITQVIEAEVESGLQRARDQMAQDPAGVIQELKLLLANVRRVPELSAGVRAQLVDRIEAALREAARREVELEAQQQAAQQALAAARERQRLTDRLTRDQQKARQLVDRMNSLIAEGRYVEAEEGPGGELAALPIRSDVAVAAVLTARFAGYDVRNDAVDVASSRAFVDALALVERSSIPFPDEPPIVYPDAPVWEELTLRRRKYASVDLKQRGGAEEKIREALEENTNFEFIETRLSEVVDYLRDLHDIEIQIDQKALDDVGIGTDTPVTRNLKGIRLRSALRLMLRELDLTYVIRDEVLLITTPEEVENLLTTKVYPVADLVLPIPQTGFQGGFGGLGGFGGGNQGGGGGMGFGQGGGGMGGFGGGGMGGGGFGGGGGGGGFFNVADDAETAPAERPVLKLFEAEEPAQPQPTEAPAAKQPREKAPAIEIDLDAKPDVFWNDLFARQRVEPRAVREAARQLLQERQEEHLIALCQAALRNGQPQPWMYETLGLAMQLHGSPKEDIERALMSAVDFGAGASDRLYIADYLVRLGLDERALTLYRQVAQLEPLRPEPYVHALQIAQRLGDLETTKWATVGVLRQAWPAEQASVEQQAFRIAQATLQRLKNEKRSQDYAAYKKQLDAALLRDCVVKVTWTGDADVDLLVEEPSGTICSLRTPRTTGGGVMLGDTSAQNYVQAASGEYSEIYTCPQGFAGTYRVLLRRVWGKVTAGKVTVDVYTNYGSQAEKHERQQIALGDQDAVAVFNLDEGRRQEPLAEQQLANAAARQVALNRAVLAQQLSAITDPRLGVPSRDGLPLGALNLGGGVGFQPVIITLPEGTNFAVTGVISADRRYVRITSIPFFSGIGEVTTFTFAGASQETGVGGNGGANGN